MQQPILWLLVSALFCSIMVYQPNDAHPDKPYLCDAQTCSDRFANTRRLSRHSRNCVHMLSESAAAAGSPLRHVEQHELPIVEEDVNMLPPVSSRSMPMYSFSHEVPGF
jgi:hypothetical protein